MATHDVTDLNYWFSLYNSDPQKYAYLLNDIPHLYELVQIQNAQNSYDRGESSAQDLLRAYGENPGITMRPETEKWLDNEIARENTQQQQNFEITSRDTSLLSAGQQLQQLGLSASGVLQTGGASAGVQGSTADTAMRSNSALRQQAKINRFNQQMGLAKSLIGTAGQMASSGIYGAAIGAVKNSAQALAGAAAHSAHDALSATQSLGKFKASDLPKMPSQKVGGFYSIFE